MAALPYMQFYVADYLADTMHLTTIQHGAYLLLIMNYWQTGKPLKNCDKRLANITGMTIKEWEKNRAVLQEFFIVNHDTWTQKRIESDLAAVREKSDSAKVGAKVSVARRQNKRLANVEQTLSYTEQIRTDTEQIRTEQTNARATAEIFTAYENEIGIISPTVKDLLTDAINTYPAEWIKTAITEAVKNGARKFSYIDAILKRWKTEGFSRDTPPKSRMAGAIAGAEAFLTEE